MYSHVLTIGCTGMLREAAVALAGRCRVMTSVARTQASLRAIDAAIHGADCAHHTLSADWSHPEAFVDAVATHVREAGAPDLVLAWLHDDALGPQLAQALAPTDMACAFFQVRGSAAADPSEDAGRLLASHNIPATVGYHQVILGFHLDEDGSRWLRDSEICTGVLAAIDHPQSVTIVGTTTPWSDRL